MRKGFLGSLTAVLAGTALAFAEPPATSDPATAVAPHGTAPSMPLPPPHPAGEPLGDGPRSPYWPNPYGYLHGWEPPAAPHGGLPESKPHGELITWGSAEYLLWWVKNQPLGVPLV